MLNLWAAPPELQHISSVVPGRCRHPCWNLQDNLPKVAFADMNLSKALHESARCNHYR